MARCTTTVNSAQSRSGNTVFLPNKVNCHLSSLKKEEKYQQRQKWTSSVRCRLTMRLLGLYLYLVQSIVNRHFKKEKILAQTVLVIMVLVVSNKRSVTCHQSVTDLACACTCRTIVLFTAKRPWFWIRLLLRTKVTKTSQSKTKTTSIKTKTKTLNSLSSSRLVLRLTSLL